MGILFIIIIFMLIRSFIRGLSRFASSRNKKRYILSCLVIWGLNLVILLVMHALNISFNSSAWFFFILVFISHVYLRSIL